MTYHFVVSYLWIVESFVKATVKNVLCHGSSYSEELPDLKFSV